MWTLITYEIDLTLPTKFDGTPGERKIRIECASKADAVAQAAKLPGTVGIYRNGSMKGTSNNGSVRMFEV